MIVEIQKKEIRRIDVSDMPLWKFLRLASGYRENPDYDTSIEVKGKYVYLVISKLE